MEYKTAREFLHQPSTKECIKTIRELLVDPILEEVRSNVYYEGKRSDDRVATSPVKDDANGTE